MKIDKYLLFDGAMGTYYASKNRPYNLTQANLLDYNTIVSIHREYILSGAMAIKTNTFGVSDLDSIKAAIDAAKDAVRDSNTLIFASIGPILEFSELDYIQIIDTIIAKGIYNFLFETFPFEDIVIKCADYIKNKISKAFIITSFAVDQNGYTSYGINYNSILSQIKLNKSIDAYGFNCIAGPVHMKELALELDNSDILSIMPNAGYPSYINNKLTYTDNPEYFANKMLEIHQLGIKIIGGCCGTTPKHIERTKKLLDSDFIMPERDKAIEQKIIHKKLKNSFKEKLSEDKVIIVEYDPPQITSAEEITNTAIMFEKAGADAISIADNPLGRARADSLLIASRIKRDTNKISVIPHLTCRDRNAISIRSALMGLNIEEINNILCITGDPVPNCNIKEIKGVYSFNSISLLSYIKNINNELHNGIFYTGAALNVNANHYHLELDRAQKKHSAGAKYFITQPCFSRQSIDNVILAKEKLKIPIIAGIMPIKSYKNALFIQSEISGINVPDDIVVQYKDKTPEECYELSIDISINIIKQLRPFINGFHLITPFKGENGIERLIKEIKNL